MKSVKRASRILLWVSVLLSIPVMAVALNNNKAPAPAPAPASHPSAPAYHPSAPAYHPSAPAPSHPSYSPPASHPSYNPAPSHSYSPQSGSSPSAPVHSYTPGSPSAGNSSGTHSYTGGATTYTPHVYTPGSPATSHPSGSTIVSGEGARTTNGVTTYTPHASTGTPRQLHPLRTSTPTLPEPQPLHMAAVTLRRHRAAVLPLRLPRPGAIPMLLIVRRPQPQQAATPSHHIAIRQQAHLAARHIPYTTCRVLREQQPASRARAAPRWGKLDRNPCCIR